MSHRDEGPAGERPRHAWLAGQALGFDALARAGRRDEPACVAKLLAALGSARPPAAAVATLAAERIAAIRERQPSRIDMLIHAYALSTAEGRALMSLAEALLRVPDDASANALIRDKLLAGDWRAPRPGPASQFVELASHALRAGRGLASDTRADAGAAGALAQGRRLLLRRGARIAMRVLGRHFVMGETIEAALARARAGAARGYTHSFDMLGEAALSADDAAGYLAGYEGAIDAVARAAAGRAPGEAPAVSVKLSALHPRYERAHRDRVLAELLPRLRALCLRAMRGGVALTIDAEEADRLALSLELLDALLEDPALASWQGLGVAVQAYQRRALALVEHLIGRARATRHRLALRLVKGAYWDGEIKKAQVDGLDDYPVFTRKAHTDLSYFACAHRMLDAPDAVYPQFATHNAQTVATIETMASMRGVDDYEFQCLHGMGAALYDAVVAGGRRCRIYAPVGAHRTLLPYLVRRLLENGSNASFVHRVADPAAPLEALLADPVDAAIDGRGAPAARIGPPYALYPDGRGAAAGLDLADDATIAALERALDAARATRHEAAPMLVRSVPARANEAVLPVRNPARVAELVGSVRESGPDDVDAALAAAAAEDNPWRRLDPDARARRLDAAGQALEDDTAALLSLCVREAGKTWPSALAEIREAVDFCRHHAATLRAEAARGWGESAPPPGAAVCISPWNFPLAIFVGQIATALSAGLPVVAKPAEQTPLAAAHAVRLMHAAGIPAAALALLPGAGERVGAALVSDRRARAVLFTGSTEVARGIERALAARDDDPMLVAETGGQNAMIVDSTALAEQVVRDAIASAFDSAGQRCSALRLLCVQREVAEPLLALLRSTLAERRLGDPARVETDIGPVIDDEARERIDAHVEAMRARGHRVERAAPPADCAHGHFVAPTLIEVGSPADLRAEVFGPVLHWMRFDAARIDALLDAIDAGGHALTFGVQTRIDERSRALAERSAAGNVYVNRNMIGAVVGTQPFGGSGLSGTGPKAGGPLILHRLRATAALTPAALGARAASDDDGPNARVAPLQAWARARGDDALATWCERAAMQSLAGASIALPGPTGESNMLRFRPRGVVRCVADSVGGLLEQLVACAATANTARLGDDAPARAVRAMLAEAGLDTPIEPQHARGRPAAVLCTGDTRALRRELAAADEGPIVAVIGRNRDRPDAPYPLWRLSLEQTVTVNTAAAGGDAALVSGGGC